MILKQLSFSNKLGDNIVTVTNNFLTHSCEDFPSYEFFPCFTIIGDTGKRMEKFRITKVTFLHDVCRERQLFPIYNNMGMCFCLLYLIKIFKMAAELYKGVFPNDGQSDTIFLNRQWQGVCHSVVEVLYSSFYCFN